ncbi:MAG TPA: DUF6370 family protein [Candidatus Limnocylindria bacterium]|jgi:hypothetical protein|nr:DUF6370 family protein [Candidatus Limnocylindria bacterium]
MKNLLKLIAVAVLATSAYAADKETTLTGEGKCAKCALHKADKCQNVVEVKEKGSDKTTIYYLTGEVSQKFHKDNLCSDSKKVTVTGKISEKDGKKEIEVSKIEAAKS